MFPAHLRCFHCGASYSYDARAYLCANCGGAGILDVIYEYSSPNFRGSGVFRYLDVLPIDAPAPILPVGDTPLIDAPKLAAGLGIAKLWIKDETRNPTRCLKDRATVIAVTQALARGCTDLYCASAGNAAISLAGLCAYQGLRCHVYVPSYASATRLDWLRRYGADVHISSGNYDQAFAEAEAEGAANGWYSRNCAYNPFLVEGKKTVALEIAEQLHGQVPDWVAAPVGDGCTLGAIGKGFREAKELGISLRIPSLLGVQSEAVQPIVRRFHGEPGRPDAGETQASSIAVRQPRNFLRLLAELRAGNGEMIAVADSAIARAQDLLAKEAGLVAEFTSAAALAGLAEFAKVKSIQSAVMVLTGGRPD